VVINLFVISIAFTPSVPVCKSLLLFSHFLKEKVSVCFQQVFNADWKKRYKINKGMLVKN